MQTNIFTPKVDQIFDDPKEGLLVVKNYHFWEMTPGYPTLWVWCRKIVETSKTCKILLYLAKWQVCSLFVSLPNTYEWVSVSLKCTKVAVKFCYVFWEMTPGFPTWCRVGRVVLSRNDKLLLGEKSPSTYLGIIERGDGNNWIWAKLPLVELSQVTARGGITFNLYL